MLKLMKRETGETVSRFAHSGWHNDDSVKG